MPENMISPEKIPFRNRCRPIFLAKENIFASHHLNTGGRGGIVMFILVMVLYSDSHDRDGAGQKNCGTGNQGSI